MDAEDRSGVTSLQRALGETETLDSIVQLFFRNVVIQK